MFLAQFARLSSAIRSLAIAQWLLLAQGASELDRFLRTSRQESLVWVNQFTHGNEMSKTDRQLIEGIRRKHKESIDRSTLLLWIISTRRSFARSCGLALCRCVPYPCRVTDSLEQAWRDSAGQLPDIDPEQASPLHRSWIRQAESSSPAESALPQKTPNTPPQTPSMVSHEHRLAQCETAADLARARRRLAGGAPRSPRLWQSIAIPTTRWVTARPKLVRGQGLGRRDLRAVQRPVLRWKQSLGLRATTRSTPSSMICARARKWPAGLLSGRRTTRSRTRRPSSSTPRAREGPARRRAFRQRPSPSF